MSHFPRFLAPNNRVMSKGAGQQLTFLFTFFINLELPYLLISTAYHPLESMDPFDQFIELAGWPKDLDLIGRERLLSLWTFSCQPAAVLRASVFDKLTSVLSSQEAQDWEEKEWMDVVLAIRNGSAYEKSRLANVMFQHYVNRKPEVLVPLMTALYSRETNESSADPQIMRSSNLRQESAVADSVTSNPASGDGNLPAGAGNDRFCGPAPDSTVTATGGEVRLGVGAVSTGDITIGTQVSNEPRPSTSRKAAASDVRLSNSSSQLTARAGISVSGNSSNKRNIPEADEQVSERNTKSPRLHLKQYSGVVQLSVSDIQGTPGLELEDGCIKVDSKKWETIMKSCQPSTKIILPEGSFSFPPKYDLWPSQSEVTISGSETSPEKTVICYHPPSVNAKPMKPTLAVIIGLWNEMTLENVSVKAKFPQEGFWPSVVLFGDKCKVKNVTFHGSGFGIESNRNLVDNLKFFGEVETAAVARLPTTKLAHGIYILTPGNSGNFLKNMYVQDFYCGIWKVNKNPWSKLTDPGMTDMIENVTCRNVKFGVNLKRCWGATVKNVTWHWDWKVKEEIRTEIPAAVQILGGQENVVSAVTCQGNGKNFYGFVLNDEANSGVPKKNKISCVKGAFGRYWDNGEGTKLFYVEG